MNLGAGPNECFLNVGSNYLMGKDQFQSLVGWEKVFVSHEKANLK